VVDAWMVSPVPQMLLDRPPSYAEVEKSEIANASEVHSFIHLENLYSAASRKLLRGASSPTTVKKISFNFLSSL